MMVTGRIKQLVRDRGFGFITMDDGSNIFFHHSGLQGASFESLREGQRVSFDVEQGQKGPRAVHVQLATAVPSRQSREALVRCWRTLGAGLQHCIDRAGTKECTMAWEVFPFRNKPGGGFWPTRWHPSRWQFHQVSFQLIGVIAAVIAFIWLASGTYIVGPDQRGIVLRFGRHVTSTDPGVHWVRSYPFEGVLRPKVTEVQRIEIGFRTTDPGPPARYAQVPSEALMLSGDENIIDIMLAEAYEKEQAIRGEGDANATRIYAQAFQKDADFFTLVRTLEAYRKSLKGNTTLMLPPQMEFPKYLQEYQ